MDEEFQNACQKQTEDALKQSRDSIASLRNDLASTNLVLIPNGVSGPSVFDDTDKTCREKFARWRHAYSDNPRHLAGTLAMVILLSLGAPFWFNALRQLSNLKPSISQKVEGEEKPDAQNSQRGGAAGNRGV
jgi:hypothetical protein